MAIFPLGLLSQSDASEEFFASFITTPDASVSISSESVTGFLDSNGGLESISICYGTSGFSNAIFLARLKSNGVVEFIREFDGTTISESPSGFQLMELSDGTNAVYGRHNDGTSETQYVARFNSDISTRLWAFSETEAGQRIFTADALVDLSTDDIYTIGRAESYGLSFILSKINSSTGAITWSALQGQLNNTYLAQNSANRDIYISSYFAPAGSSNQGRVWAVDSDGTPLWARSITDTSQSQEVLTRGIAFGFDSSPLSQVVVSSVGSSLDSSPDETVITRFETTSGLNPRETKIEHPTLRADGLKIAVDSRTNRIAVLVSCNDLSSIFETHLVLLDQDGAFLWSAQLTTAGSAMSINGIDFKDGKIILAGSENTDETNGTNPYVIVIPGGTTRPDFSFTHPNGDTYSLTSSVVSASVNGTLRFSYAGLAGQFSPITVERVSNAKNYQNVTQPASELKYLSYN